MPNTKRNALAELSERLETHICPIMGCVGSRATGRALGGDVRTAQLIIEELAKVGFNERGQPRDEWIACETVEKCRAIAEEGGKE